MENEQVGLLMDGKRLPPPIDTATPGGLQMRCQPRDLRWDTSSASNFTGGLTLHAETQQCKHCYFTAGLASKMVIAIWADLAQDAPTFRTQPRDVEAEIGKSVTLTCDVDSYPAPEIRWLHQEEDQNIRVGRTANLTLTLDTHTAGRYICIATVPGYPEIETTGSIFIKGPPKILSNYTQFGSQGDSVKIECAAFSVPRIDSIVWTFDGKEIDSIHDQDYAFLEDLQPGGVVNSTLIVRESQSKHFGTYRCNVSNEYGSDAMDIILKPNKKPDVTVTAEELYKENDRNSNISDLKLELRQANGSCEVDYPNTGSDSTLCSNAKLGSGIPLAGTVPLNSISQNNTYQPYRYSNDYTDPAYADCYKVNGYQTYVHYGHDYTQGLFGYSRPR
ncbi:hypothetical protein MSG28_015719 [Choristoneura fumiferana]|uniref:Uncharacterized protein n=1 Tax=Choristoneura fumiferana TaxID=7141 RepID=A0ACC0KB41_CHOFU|nr:hypothetical protein MSG28_015719 [Choristoneura fumiferana]